MNSNKYICPKCNEEMCWTGEICQNPNEHRYCSILYVYQCGNIDCGYKSRYKNLDSAGEMLCMMIQNSRQDCDT